MNETWGRYSGGPPQNDIARRASTLMTGLGAVLIFLGVLAVASSFFAGVMTMVTLGGLLLVGGIAHLLGGLARRGHGAVAPVSAAGIVYVVVGILLISHPAVGAAGLTLIVAAFFLMSGLVRIASWRRTAPPRRGDTLAIGIAALVLSLIVLANWPTLSLWLVGTLVGIELLLAGLALLGTGSMIRRATG